MVLTTSPPPTLAEPAALDAAESSSSAESSFSAATDAAPPPSAPPLVATLDDGPGRNAKLPTLRRDLVVLDYAKVFDGEESARLAAGLRDLEANTGWKLRVVTGYGAEYPPMKELYDYFGADRRTIVMTADEYKGNVIEFYYDTQALKPVVPKNVFQELRGRFGNKYATDEEGLAVSVLGAADALTDCLNRGGCDYVPGLSRQQREFSLVAVLSGGFLFGAVGKNKVSAWTYVFCAIWVPWVGLFGFYPLYIRQPEDLSPLWENLALFVAVAAVTAKSPALGGGDARESPTTNATLEGGSRPTGGGEER